MKDAIKTIVLTIVILIIGSIVFAIVTNLEQGIELLSRSKLPITDPDVKLLYDRIEDNTDLRKASLNVNDLSNQEILELVIDNLTKEDYEKKTVEAEKIVCQVTKKISFNTEDKNCKIRIISNSVFNDYIKENYSLDKELDFVDFDYHGYNCKNSGKKYYCMYSSYKDYVYGYSLFDSAYKAKDSIIINEYYLQVDVSDGDRCYTYFDEEYCADYKENDKKDVSDRIIKKDGVLYEHVFSLIDGKYYLQKSYVKNEG